MVREESETNDTILINTNRRHMGEIGDVQRVWSLIYNPEPSSGLLLMLPIVRVLAPWVHLLGRRSREE